MTTKNSRSTEGSEPRGERLQKALSAAGACSRRAAEELIIDGRVSVNGLVVRELGTRVGPDDVLAVDGEIVERHAERRYILLNKPAGYVTTVDDPQGRPTVMEFVADEQPGLFPVGRLDLPTEGLLLLTDDGELANRLMHPRYHVPKTYEATVSVRPGERELRKLADGIVLDDGRTAPAEVGAVRTEGRHTVVTITLHEGRKRQVRRMFDAIGHPVERLVRVRFGPLDASGLAPGEWRRLRPEEVQALYSASVRGP
jgi:pseudouridine synthase